ncbi:hypothetical protein FRUB_01793 [Fimbriiglobus ruber]|uniref:Uncharacterized protein n=1 Tax=Fimbriiglobus ruber TaxID=1908690 RepID=A0A225DVR5_9BACT|nr:hypothetical protein FRUB_01793 [Fimbriiglobus ruber]
MSVNGTNAGDDHTSPTRNHSTTATPAAASRQHEAAKAEKAVPARDTEGDLPAAEIATIERRVELRGAAQLAPRHEGGGEYPRRRDRQLDRALLSG